MILIKTFLKDILKKLNINAYSDFLMFKLRTKNEINKESNIYKFYNKLLKRDHLIFDIGANIGNHAAVFSKLGKKVICVEPQNYCYKFLKLRFSGNKNVVVINKALDAQNGMKTLYLSNDHVISSMSTDWIKNVKESGRFKNYLWNETVTVETISLDNLIYKYGLPNYCKIDVEGYEYNVLKGLSSKIPLISFELSYENINIAFKCIKHLASLGEIELNLVFGDFKGFNFDVWMNKDDFITHLKSLNDKTIVADIFVKFKL